MTIAIIPFDMDSYDAVIALWKQCEGVHVSDADSRENMQAYLARNPGMSFVATDNGEVVGAIQAGHDGRRGYIYHLAVHPSCRRRGIARRLVEGAVAGLRDAGIQRACMFIFDSNSGGAEFWTSMGWTAPTDFGMMWKNLEP